MSDAITIGIIGGSGVYELDNMKTIEERSIETPFGPPSDNYIIGELNGTRVAFLSRHGRGHRLTPSELNVRANIYGFKTLGVKYLTSVSAVGSLQEEIKPTHIVFPDQVIDRTRGSRINTFFGNGIVAHIGFADPFCGELTSTITEAAARLDIPHHTGKTYICMEGPAFSTRAESNLHRSIGGDIIGMTAIPEAKLAREAEMCYAMIALSTDYDCWKEDEEAVSVEMVIDNLNKNRETAKKLLSEIIPTIKEHDCACHHTLDFAMITDKTMWPEKTKSELEPIIKRFL
jgi:5'-methylthioadenosine phosphorylase